MSDRATRSGRKASNSHKQIIKRNKKSIDERKIEIKQPTTQDKKKLVRLCQILTGTETVKSLRSLAKKWNIPKSQELSKENLCLQTAAKFHQTLRKIKKDEVDLPADFTDPVSGEPLYNPYIMDDEFSYNHNTLRRLFKENDEVESPLRKDIMLYKNKMLFNRGLKNAVVDWLIKWGQELEYPDPDLEEDLGRPSTNLTSEEADEKGGYFLNGIYTLPQTNYEENDHSDEEFKRAVGRDRSIRRAFDAAVREGDTEAASRELSLLDPEGQRVAEETALAAFDGEYLIERERLIRNELTRSGTDPAQIEADIQAWRSRRQVSVSQNWNLQPPLDQDDSKDPEELKASFGTRMGNRGIDYIFPDNIRETNRAILAARARLTTDSNKWFRTLNKAETKYYIDNHPGRFLLPHLTAAWFLTRTLDEVKEKLNDTFRYFRESMEKDQLAWRFLSYYKYGDAIFAPKFNRSIGASSISFYRSALTPMMKEVYKDEPSNQSLVHICLTQGYVVFKDEFCLNRIFFKIHNEIETSKFVLLHIHDDYRDYLKGSKPGGSIDSDFHIDLKATCNQNGTIKQYFYKDDEGRGIRATKVGQKLNLLRVSDFDIQKDFKAPLRQVDLQFIREKDKLKYFNIFSESINTNHATYLPPNVADRI